MDQVDSPEQSLSTEGFVYNIVVDVTCELFQNEPFKSKIPRFGEMTIDSEIFSDHRECQEDAAQLLISFANNLRQLTGKRYVIATKLNPMHDAESNENASFDPWEEDMVMKMYLADAARLKNDNAIDSSIMATVRVQRTMHEHNLIPQ